MSFHIVVNFFIKMQKQRRKLFLAAKCIRETYTPVMLLQLTLFPVSILSNFRTKQVFFFPYIRFKEKNVQVKNIVQNIFVSEISSILKSIYPPTQKCLKADLYIK